MTTIPFPLYTLHMMHLHPSTSSSAMPVSHEGEAQEALVEANRLLVIMDALIARVHTLADQIAAYETKNTRA